MTGVPPMTAAAREALSLSMQQLAPLIAMTSGVAGHITPIPEGWVQVTYFPFEGRDDIASDYTAPVVLETSVSIRIEVWGEQLAFPKSRCIITHGEKAA